MIQDACCGTEVLALQHVFINVSRLWCNIRSPLLGYGPGSHM